MPGEASEDGGGVSDKGGRDEIAELHGWLWDRVADDRDIVVDDMQEEFFPDLEKKDDQNQSIQGTNVSQSDGSDQCFPYVLSWSMERLMSARACCVQARVGFLDVDQKVILELYARTLLIHKFVDNSRIT